MYHWREIHDDIDVISSSDTKPEGIDDFITDAEYEKLTNPIARMIRLSQIETISESKD